MIGAAIDRFIATTIDPLDLLTHAVIATAIAESERCALCRVYSKVSWPGGQL